MEAGTMFHSCCRRPGASWTESGVPGAAEMVQWPGTQSWMYLLGARSSHRGRHGARVQGGQAEVSPSPDHGFRCAFF